MDRFEVRCFWFSQNGAEAPSTRYRGIYLLEELRRSHGVRTYFAFPSYKPNNILRFVWNFLWALLSAKEDDLIVVQKVISVRIYAHLLQFLVRRTRARTLYDLDDAEYLRYTDVTLKRFVATCDAVMVGSEALGRYVEPMNPNWFLATSPIVPHGVVKTAREGLFTIGWIGFFDDHKENLETLVLPALRSLGGGFRFVVLGVRFDADESSLRASLSDLPGVEIEIPRQIDWLDERSVYERIGEFDVGLAPLLDTEHARAKSAFKAKQYLSCGVPVLGSPVGENLRFIRDEINGFVCDGPQDYLRNLIRIRDASDLAYVAMSIAALESASEFSLQKLSVRVLDRGVNRTLAPNPLFPSRSVL